MISKTVSLQEATKSQTAIRLGIDNTPTTEQMTAIADTAVHVVDAVRTKFAGVDVSSFFRSPKLNKKVGGSTTSQHCKGEAVDLDSKNDGLNMEIFNFVKDNLVFDQLILEYPDANGTPSWVHVSFVQHPKTNRGQILVKLKDRYIPYGEYQKGMI